jgi:hypothetical protein
MSFITTPYLTLAEAQTYFDGRLDTTAWDCADTGRRTKALLQATRAIDRLNFAGEKADEDQALQFPRLGDTVVPDDIKCATAEEALALLDGKSPEMEREALGITEQTLGPVKAKFDTSTGRSINILHGIMSATAWSFLLPYMRDPLTIRTSRVS